MAGGHLRPGRHRVGGVCGHAARTHCTRLALTALYRTQDGTFKLSLEFTEEYPNKAPTVKFVTRMFHPNIYADGSICLDILQNQWSPIYDISAILTSIQSLLCDPNPASPANSEAARLYQENRREYTIRVKEIVEQSWQGDDDVDDDGEDGKE